jgi:hypothetical protein
MTERVQIWRSALFAGLLFGVLCSLISGLVEGRIPPTSMADLRSLLANFFENGLLFGLLIGLFLWSPIVPKPRNVALSPGETLVQSSLANHFLNFESRGGRLALTTTHLRFVPHILNIQRSCLDIPVEEIIKASPIRILKIFSNGLAVLRSSGRTEYFVVNDRLSWLDALNAKKSAK